jgi:hypothetical protein
LKWLEKKTDKGILKYRMPNVVEGYEFLALIETVNGSSGFFKAKAKFISNLYPLLDYSSLGYKDYSDLLDDKVTMMHPLSEISQEVFDDITGALAKKP